MRIALGVAVFSGLIGVTFFGLFFTPVFYGVIKWLGGAWQETGRRPAVPLSQD